ncbi:MAG: aspartate kinase [Candidatus Eremiobacteraeota bacterium]|nr:aspartate kinase [Candidatus Eremiobacteraeota bacterium]MBV8223236.1 aspartate kinase [Candidatus Eremiobacteraeota bacterium]
MKDAAHGSMDSLASTASRKRKDLVVMKFGGSSLATPQLRDIAVQRVKDEISKGMKPIIVVSAIGRAPDPYATDTLLELAPGRVSANRDLLASCGESISAAVFATLLEKAGISARAMTGSQAGIHTDKRHGNARIVRTDPNPVLGRLNAGVTPVIAGFQGLSPDGAITTLGRGGSDLTAVALAKALGSVRCEIFTDVDGVMTADPKRVPQAHTIGELTFEEVDELAANGANIMHDRAAALAREGETPYSVLGLNTGAGTDIQSERPLAMGQPVTGVATVPSLAFLHLVPEAAAMPGGWELDALRRLSGKSISIDCVNINRAGLFFCVRGDDLHDARRALEDIPVALRFTRDCAKISIVGAGMRGTPGVMAAVVQTLVDASVPIVHSTDSNITISVIVPGTHAAAAEAALHKHFGLG